jgi:hypothetical protein
MLEHVLRKMNISQKFKLWCLRRRYVQTLKKMDKAILTGKKEKAYMYEDKMYQCDEKLESFLQHMNLKYA